MGEERGTPPPPFPPDVYVEEHHPSRVRLSPYEYPISNHGSSSCGTGVFHHHPRRDPENPMGDNGALESSMMSLLLFPCVLAPVAFLQLRYRRERDASPDSWTIYLPPLVSHPCNFRSVAWFTMWILGNIAVNRKMDEDSS